MRGWVSVLLTGMLVLVSCAGDDSADSETPNRTGNDDAVDEFVEESSSDELSNLYVESLRGQLDSYGFEEDVSPEALAVMNAMTDAEMSAEGQRFCDEAVQFDGDPDGLTQWFEEMVVDPGSFELTTEVEVFVFLGGAAMAHWCPEMLETFAELDPSL